MPVETPSDRNYACFFCIQGQTKDLSSRCPRCGQPIEIGHAFEGQHIGDYTLVRYVRRGFYGATFCAQNRIGKDFAVKLSPTALYDEQGKNFEEEIQNYRKLGNHPNIAELIDAGGVRVTVDGRSIEMFYVVMEWIDGIPLSRFLIDHAFSLTVHTAYGAILDIAAGVARFESQDLWHNDLNSDNILVKGLTLEEQATRRSDSPYICKIVDSGSAVFRQAERRKVLADVVFLGQHINAMRRVLLRHASVLPKEDRFFVDELAKIVSHAQDEHPERAAATATVVMQEVEDLYARRLFLDDDAAPALADPFSSLNANDLSDTLVNMLFSGQFPWLKTIMAPDIQSLLITGPRGSGKTMILRSMRLKTKLYPHLRGDSDEEIRKRIERDGFVGFFISARLEIGNNCPLTKLPQWAENPHLVNEFFNLLYLYEIADTLHLALQRRIISIPREGERQICEEVSTRLGVGGLVTFSGLASTIQMRQNSITQDRYDGSVPPGMVGPSVLSAVCDLLKRSIPFFSNKNIVFLLDDFSLPKVPSVIQGAVLPIIWNPGGGYSFKVSAHSESMVTVDVRDIVYAVNREFTEVNLGAQYINGIDLEQKMDVIKGALEDVVTRRLKLSDSYQPRSLDDVLGAERNVPIAATIRRLHKSKRLRTLRYAGWPTLLRLCSGDVSYVIDVLRRIVREHWADERISADTQHREIRRYARDDLVHLRDHAVTSCDLHEVATSFGEFSLHKLLHNDVGKEKRPAEYLRIEVQLDRMTSTGEEALVDLLRNGVFVDGGFSSSSQGRLARRLIFKKLFTPAFPTTYHSRDTWPMTAAHFAEFVSSPAKYVRRILRRRSTSEDPQLDL